jgi:hypothetical protein
MTLLTLQVIKVGTSSLIRAEQQTLNLTSIAGIVETVRDMKQLGNCLQADRHADGAVPPCPGIRCHSTAFSF